MSGDKIVSPLGPRLAYGPLPVSLTLDHGTEFKSKALEKWAWRRGEKLDFTSQGSQWTTGTQSSLTGFCAVSASTSMSA
jgi:putative transposase